MARIFIAVGSNIEPRTNIPEALRILKNIVTLEAVSTFYETQPIDHPEQSVFINGVFLVSTELGPRELKYDVLRSVEKQLGRNRIHDKYSPRTIDLDIILYDNLIIDRPDMVIPDPEIYERAFVAIPIFELAPNLAIPGASITINEIAGRLKDRTYAQVG